jgi:hypothetical protein
MGLWERCQELLGLKAPIAVHDPAADEGRAPVPGQLQPDLPDLEPKPPEVMAEEDNPSQTEALRNRAREVLLGRRKPGSSR